MASENYKYNAEPSIMYTEEGEMEQIASGTHFVDIHNIKSEIKEETSEFQPFNEYGAPNECLEKHKNEKCNDTNSCGFEVMPRNSVDNSQESKFSSTDFHENEDLNRLAGELAKPKVDHFENEVIFENDDEDHPEYIDLINAGLKKESFKTEYDIDIIYENIKPEICEEKSRVKNENEFYLNSVNDNLIGTKIGPNVSCEFSKDSETWPQQNIEEDEASVVDGTKKQPTITSNSKNCQIIQNYPFESNQEFKERSHTGEKAFQCKSCSKSFTIRYNLLRHERTHTGKKEFQCQICLKSFTVKDTLLVHERIHTGEKPFQCKVCPKSFANGSTLLRHNRIHTGEKPFQCKICPRSFADRNSLLYHTKKHTGEKPFQCKVCRKSFTAKENLLNHERIHTGEKPFQCKLCSMSFAVNSSMLRHKKIHTPDKPFLCKICSKSFIQKRYLTKHMRIHTKEKPFQCKICPKSFADKN